MSDGNASRLRAPARLHEQAALLQPAPSLDCRAECDRAHAPTTPGIRLRVLYRVPYYIEAQTLVAPPLAGIAPDEASPLRWQRRLNRVSHERARLCTN
jgi:hypothetical protein